MGKHSTEPSIRLSKFWGDNNGATAVLFAFMAMMLLVSTGIAIDFSSAQSERTSMQAAVDAAALAAATSTQSTDQGDDEDGEPAYSLVAKNFFKLNFPGHSSVNVSATVDSGAINVTAIKNYTTKMLSIIGINTVPISVQASVPSIISGSAEVVLVLDYSDSMLDNDKYMRLKDAANHMIDKLSDNGNNTNVKFGIVPFAALVRADLPGSYIRSDVTYNGCTQDRRYPANTQEAAGGSDDAKWGEITSTHSCADMDAAGLKVVPLNSDVNIVKTKLNAMEPYLWTHIAAGADFGWQVISPTGPFATASPHSDNSNLKVFVLMTDGMQTALGWGPGPTQSAAHGESNLSAICTGMKQQGIEVYTVGYDLSDTHTLNLLQTCANSGNFYDAQDVDTGLLASFSAISNKVATALLRLTK